MDFIVRLRTTSKGYSSIWVIIDRFTKFKHFVAYSDHIYPQLAKLYEIVWFYGVPLSIILDRVVGLQLYFEKVYTHHSHVLQEESFEMRSIRS